VVALITRARNLPSFTPQLRRANLGVTSPFISDGLGRRVESTSTHYSAAVWTLAHGLDVSRCGGNP